MGIFLSLFLSFSPAIIHAKDVGRSPAVVKNSCDLNIETLKEKEGSEKVFQDTLQHYLTIRSDDDRGCSAIPKKRYSDSILENYARNEVKILFQKYSEKYSKKCISYFKKLSLNIERFHCEMPEIDTMKFSDFSCDKKIEEGTNRVFYIANAKVSLAYHMTGKIIEEKTVEAVQKEQCNRVNQCLSEVSRDQKDELFQLQKLKDVACKSEIVAVETSRAPAIEHDDSFDGKRRAKDIEKEYVDGEKVHSNTLGK